MAAIAKWKVTLEFESDDGYGPSQVVLSETGDWKSDRPDRPVNECIAITMSSIIAMILESGSITGHSDMAGSVKAFSGE